MKTNHTKVKKSKHMHNGNMVKLKMDKLTNGHMKNWAKISSIEWHMVEQDTCGLTQHMWLDIPLIAINGIYGQIWHMWPNMVHIARYTMCYQKWYIWPNMTHMYNPTNVRIISYLLPNK